MYKKIKWILGGLFLIVIIFISIGTVKVLQTKRLFKAIEEQNNKAVLAAINKGADVNATKHIFAIQEIVWHNPTPLIAACKVGNKETIEILLKSGADINQCDPWANLSPLEYVLGSENKNRFEISMYLIENGANYKSFSSTYTAIERSVTIYDSDGEDTIKQGYNLFEYLMQNKGYIDDLHGVHTLLTYASSNDNERVIEYLVKNQYADVDEKNENGMTGLMVAIQYNAKNAFEKLLELGADINICDNNGKNAYNYAADKHPEFVELLKKAEKIGDGLCEE